MWGKFLSGRPHPLPWPKFLVTRLLTRDLFILQLTVVLFNSFSLILCLIAYTVHCNKIVKFSVRLLVICIKSAVELAATATFRQLLCFYFSCYAILCIMSCRQCLFQRYCSYATTVLYIRHCKWVAHVNLSINGDDDDDDCMCVSFWAHDELCLFYRIVICTRIFRNSPALLLYLAVWAYTLIMKISIHHKNVAICNK